MPSRSLAASTLVFAFLGGACSSGGSSGSAASASVTSSGATSGSGGSAGSSGGTGGSVPGPLGGKRPVDSMSAPPGYAGQPTALVVLLHGYGASGTLQELYFGLASQQKAHPFFLVAPDGTEDRTSHRYWNATDACCSGNAAPPVPDDSTYLLTLIEWMQQHYAIDAKRIFLVGHSNGGFMSHRMACDHADKIAALVSLAGEQWEDVSKCTPSEPVAVLQIQGTADAVIPYDGGSITGSYLGGPVSAHAFPAAKQTVADWVGFDGCSPTADTSAPNLDLESALPGAETSVSRYATGCKPGGHVELWTIKGGGHIPSLSAAFAPDVIDFLFAHPKP